MKQKQKTARQRLIAGRRYKEWWQRWRPVRYVARKRDGLVRGPGCSDVYNTRRGKYICLACRKVWRNHWKDPLEKCPQCAGGVVHVSRYSRVPRARNDKAWARLEKRFRTTP